ncbi:MAG: LysR family transcriptional regulator [Alphaproteobacteria bacterium]|nr:LysR family transcriptional regulator [Alphaproteobacteria bacterium]
MSAVRSTGTRLGKAPRKKAAATIATDLPGTSVEQKLAPALKQAKLDLLPILYELLRTRSVTRTARALGISQPAVSQALRRLRATFGDDLLVAVGRDLHPTDRALTLLPSLETVLAGIGALLQPTTRFDPETEELHVMIMTADYVSLLLAPILAEICSREAPRVVYEFVSGGARSIDDLAGIDFLIAPRAFGHTLGKRVGMLPLWRDEVVCLAAARNSVIPSSIGPQAFRRLRQVAYQMNPNVPERVRTLLQPTSVLETRRVCTLPDFLVLGAVVDQADCVALVPRKVANELVRWRDLRIVELNYANKHLAIDAYWTLAAGNRRGHAWCRALLSRAAARIAAPDEGPEERG